MKLLEANEGSNIFVCYKGINRSAGASHLTEVGLNCNYFEGGTSRMRHLTPNQIKQEVPPDSLVHLIVDSTDMKQAKDAANISKLLLRIANLPFDTISTDDLLIEMRRRGISHPENFITPNP